jgi:hypothetical protein
MKDDWATTCGAVLTSTTAAEADKAACRDMLNRQGHDVQWPGAFAIAVMFAACAWAAPKILRIMGGP